MESLSAVRAEIDRLDDELVGLIERRLGLSGEVAAAKRAAGKAVFDGEREREVLAKVIARGRAENEGVLRQVFTALFEASKARQRELLGGSGV